MNGDSYAWRSRHRTRGAHSNSIPSHSPRPGAPLTAPSAAPFPGALPGAYTPVKVQPNAGLTLRPDYNIVCKCKQITEVLPLLYLRA